MILSVRTDAKTGRLVVSARIARTGVQKYPHGNEYRDAREVFAPASMASFEGVPVTVGHRAWVDAANLKELAVGFARDVHRDGIYLAAELVIFNESVADAIRARELLELSAGYACDSVHEPGVYDGEAYQRRMVGILANHVALLPSGAARCGSACSIAGR